MSIYSFPPLAASIYALILCLFIIIYNRKSSANISFAFLCLTTFVWQFSWFILFNVKDPSVASLLVKVGYSGIIFIPITFYQFSERFTNIKNAKYISYIAYLLGVTLLFLLWTSKLFINGYYQYVWGYYPKAGMLHPSFVLTLCGLSIMCVVLFLTHKKNKHNLPQINAQLNYLIWALIIYMPAATDFIVNYGYGFYPVGFIFVILSLSFIAYAIVRHRLMDIEVIIKKGVIYSVLMAAIIGIYSLLIFIGQNFFQTTLRVNQWIATIITAFVIAVGYKPLETFITDLTNQYFFRKKYDYQRTLKDSSEAMNLLTDIDRLIKLTTRIVARRMELEETSTLIYDEPNHRYIIKAAEGKSKELLGMTFSDNHDLFKHLFSSKQILVKDELIHTLNSKFLMPDEKRRLNTIRKEMERLHAQICVPSITRGKYMGNKLVAVFCMGYLSCPGFGSTVQRFNNASTRATSAGTSTPTLS